jgi:EmrB/QacA subfamily drug resistance transporter
VKRHFALATLSLVLFLTFLDNTIVSVTLAEIQPSLHTGVSQLQWIVNGYALVFASFMLTFGTLGDLFGRKKVMLAGVGVFCAGSALAALAPNADTLIAARVVMGLGAAASEPGTLSMIRHLYTDRRARARALGIWTAVSGLALAFGPVLGGTLIGIWSWRAVFWFNLLFGLVAFVAAAVVLPESSDPQNRRLDVRGFALGAGAIGAASFAVVLGETHGYLTWWIDVLFAGSLATMVAFVLFERRAANPVLNVAYFKKPPFAVSNLVAFSTYFGVFSIFFFVALYVQEVVGASGYATAIDFLPMAVVMVLASLLTGRWVAASGPRTPMITGCVLAGIGILLTDLYMTPHTGFSTLGWTLPLAGAGFGIAMVPATSTALSVVPAEHSGMAASMTNTSRELGAVAGVAVLGSVVNGQLTVNLAHRLTALGIPSQFQALVISAVESGTVHSQAGAYHGGGSLQVIVNQVVTAAYGAFGSGLDFALLTAASLILLAAVVAAFGLPPRWMPSGDASPAQPPRHQRPGAPSAPASGAAVDPSRAQKPSPAHLQAAPATTGTPAPGDSRGG